MRAMIDNQKIEGVHCNVGDLDKQHAAGRRKLCCYSFHHPQRIDDVFKRMDENDQIERTGKVVEIATMEMNVRAERLDASAMAFIQI